MRHFFINHKKTFFGVLVAVLFSATISLATPPTSQTLNPDCLPTDPACVITLSSGAAAWGSITGTLANQTDLQSALNAKQGALTFSTGLTNTSNTVTNNLSTGISGGQSVVGGTASGNNLTLSSTSNATKGKIIFGTSAYDEVNNRLGIGVASPTRKLDVSTNTGGTVMSVENTSSTGYSAISFKDTGSNAVADIGYGNSGLSAPFGNSAYFRSTGTIPIVLLTNSNERLRIASTGEIGINTSSPLAQLDINGNAILSGTSRYLNFGSTSGSSGYGLRDNSGTVEFKNNGGVWQAPLAGTGAAGKIAFWNSANTQTSSNDLSWNSTNGLFTVGTLAGSVSIDSGNISFGYNGNLTQGGISYDQDGANLQINACYSCTNHSFVYLSSAGKFGIGTASPWHTLDVAGNIGVATNGYINFNDADGVSGYGIRDNGGTIQYKNNGGSWTSLGGSAAATGNVGDVQINDGSNGFTADSNFNWDTSNNSFLHVQGNIVIGDATTTSVYSNSGLIIGEFGNGGNIGISDTSKSIVVGSAYGAGSEVLSSNQTNFILGTASSGGSIRADGTDSIIFGSAGSGGYLRGSASNSLVFGSTGNNGFIAATVDNSMVFGYAADGAYITTGGGSSLAHGEVSGEDGNGNFSYINSGGSGAYAGGNAGSGGYIAANDTGAFASGYASGTDGLGNISRIISDSIGSLSSGYAVDGAYIYNGSMGGLANGTATGNDGNGNISYLESNGIASSVLGYAFNGGALFANGPGSQVAGYANGVSVNGVVSLIHVDSNARGSQAFGYVASGGNIYAGVNTRGSLAFGDADTEGVIYTGSSSAIAHGHASGGASIYAGGESSFATGYASGSDGNGNFSAIQTNGDSAFVFGSVYDGGYLNAGSRSLVFGTAQSFSNFDGALSYIAADNEESFAWGGAFTGGFIHSGGAGSQAAGLAEGYNTNDGTKSLIETIGNGNQVFGHAVSGGSIRSNVDAGLTFGYADMGAHIYAASAAALTFGYADLDGDIGSDGLGSQAFGYSSLGGFISTSGQGSLSFGSATGIGSQIEAVAGSSFAHGNVAGGGSIIAASSGTTAGGYASNSGVISSYSLGSFAYGFVESNGAITNNAFNQGGLAFGSASGANSSIQTNGIGSVAFGSVTNGGIVKTTGDGGFAFGWADGADALISADNGAFAGGATSNGYTISGGATGAFAFGHALTGPVLATSNSFAFGDDVQTHDDYQYIFGQHGSINVAATNSFLLALGGSTTTLANANTFAVGYAGNIILQADIAGVTVNTLTVGGTLSATLPSGSFGTIASFGANGGGGLVTIGYEDGSGISSITGSGFGPFQVASSANNNILINPGSGNVGISAVSPTEKLEVGGNMRLDGAFMPGNSAGTSGQFLVSAGTNTAPTWTTLSYEAPLTFSTGFTRTSNTITDNLSTGISGGQSVIGGTASGNNLTLSSTSNTTKGKILFGASAYDEVNNELGIGTASPSFKAHIVSNSTDFSANTYGITNQFNADIANGSRLAFYKSRGTAASPTALSLNDVIGSIQFFGYDGTNYFNQSAFNIDATEAWSSTAHGTQIRFNTTTNGTTTSSERLRILNNGNLGIGITAPTGLVTLSGSRSASAWDVNGPLLQIRAITTTDTSTASSSTVTNAMINTIAVPTIAATNTSVTYTNAATLYIAGAPTAGTNVTLTNKAALVVAAGNVGIGTSAPSLLLSVGSSSATDGNQLRIQDANGTCDHNPGSGSEVVTCSSDIRLKENIQIANPALDSLNKFAIKQYDLIADKSHFSYGVIAQEVLNIDPSMVHLREDGFYGVEEVSSWKIVKAIQELDIKIHAISNLGDSSNTLAGSLIAWLGDVQNGIQSIFAKQAHIEEKICLGTKDNETCITKNQLDAILNNLPQNSNGGASSNANTAPVGENSATPAQETPDAAVAPENSSQ